MTGISEKNIIKYTQKLPKGQSIRNHILVVKYQHGNELHFISVWVVYRPFKERAVYYSNKINGKIILFFSKFFRAIPVVCDAEYVKGFASF